jgi:membrane peptidoglycan carboxypeptidase
MLGRALRTLFFGVVIGGVAVGACMAALVPGAVEIASAHRYTVDQVVRLRNLAQKSSVYWSDGTPMGELGLRDRVDVKYADLAGTPGGQRVIHAVVSIEDRTFWTNDGIDLGGVFRAFMSDVTAGKVEQGGSTITQQLVKNRVLSPARDVHRKVKEIQDALRLTKRFSKQKILEEYLNTVYFGQSSWGIDSAASRFFQGKQIGDLTIGEAALLAGLIANPEGDNPFTFPQRAWLRRATVLQAEVRDGYVTQTDANAADNEPLPTVPPASADIRPQNYLVAEVQDRLLNDPRLGSTAKERFDHLLKGGLKIYTTFDPRLQDLSTQATEEALPHSPAGPDWVSSLVAIDPLTGAVRAMVGGPDFAASQYNIATHPVGRQPGSTWKVITLATALANGYSPYDTVDGSAPCSVPSKFGAAYTVNAGDGEGGYDNLWTQTADSVNCAFVRLSTSVGQDKIMQMAYDLGITQRRLFPHLTLSIGDVEATPLEMATVIATIANDGVRQDPYFVQKVVTPDGQTLIDETARPGLGKQVLPSDVAECEQLVLRHVITGGTGTGYTDVPGHEPFGKTGTTDNRSDAWFIGATPQLATAVWFGNRTTNTLSAGFGGPTAGPIWRQFMTGALADQPDVPLPDQSTNDVCNRPGGAVNPDGGRTTTDTQPATPSTDAQTPQVVVLGNTPPAATSPGPTNTIPTAPPVSFPVPTDPRITLPPLTLPPITFPRPHPATPPGN